MESELYGGGLFHCSACDWNNGSGNEIGDFLLRRGAGRKRTAAVSKAVGGRGLLSLSGAEGGNL